jgi:CDP-diacylglycerol--serine O-phosphatidyltransferase
MLKHIPNIITLLNLLFGVLASLFLLYGQLEMAIWWVGFAALADFLDGFVARWLNVHSPLGKELDSLADMISFGLVPGIIFYGLFIQNQTGIWPNSWHWMGMPAFIITLSAGLRLARFNLDTRQSTDFIGLPTPACTLFAVGLLLIQLFYRNSIPGYLLKIEFLISFVIILSLLMQANLPMFSLKINGGWKNNKLKILFVVFCTIMLIWQPKLAPTGWITSYVLLSVYIHYFTSKKTV